MKIAELYFTFLFAASVLPACAAEDTWPPLPTSTLTIKDLGPRQGVKSVKKESAEASRDGKRVASITKADRNGDGRFEEFVFAAFVSGQRVIVLTRIGSTNESAMFFSFDDVMVMTDIRLPEIDVVALVVMSKNHSCYEIFAHQPDGSYWPADDAQKNAVDAFFRASAQAMSPIFEKLKK
jgi:hypothetical protein